MDFFKKFWIGVIQFAIQEIKTNKDVLVKDLAPYINEGEDAIVAAVTKFNAELGALVASVIAALGSEVPQYEGDGIKWLVSVLEAYVKKLQG